MVFPFILLGKYGVLNMVTETLNLTVTHRNIVFWPEKKKIRVALINIVLPLKHC